MRPGHRPKERLFLSGTPQLPLRVGGRAIRRNFPRAVAEISCPDATFGLSEHSYSLLGPLTLPSTLSTLWSRCSVLDEVQLQTPGFCFLRHAVVQNCRIDLRFRHVVRQLLIDGSCESLWPFRCHPTCLASRGHECLQPGPSLSYPAGTHGPKCVILVCASASACSPLVSSRPPVLSRLAPTAAIGWITCADCSRIQHQMYTATMSHEYVILRWRSALNTKSVTLEQIVRPVFAWTTLRVRGGLQSIPPSEPTPLRG